MSGNVLPAGNSQGDELSGNGSRPGISIGKMLMGLGLVLLLGAAGICAYNVWDETRADAASREVLSELIPEIPAAETEGSGADGNETSKPIQSWVLNPDLAMPEVMIGGEAYIGTVSIPALKLTLPVMSSWDYEKLKTAPCRYSGSVYKDDMVICAHNYGRHFSGIKGLLPGESVIFTDADGNVFRYTVSDVEILNPVAIEEMTSGDWDLTLFTCTTGGQTRFALRCQRMEP
jgi:sortase A